MTNKEKANQLVKLTHSYEDGLAYMHTDRVLYENLMEMAEWKDQKFQEILDYAEICYGVFTFEQRDKFIEHIKEIYYDR